MTLSSIETQPSPRIAITENRWGLLFAETGGFCPLCGRALIGSKGGHLVKLGDAAHIYPHRITEEQRLMLYDIDPPLDIESLENLILLCDRCHVYQDVKTTRSDYEKLLDAKRKLSRSNLARTRIADIPIEEGLSHVIKALSALKSDEITPLKMDPHKVCEKIADEFLKDDVIHHVMRYFEFIQERFSDLDAIDEGMYDDVASTMRLVYVKLRRLTGNEQELFDRLVEWVKSKTQCSTVQAAVIVSYFVQDCEVFDAVPK